jgi:hypothetical protein
VEEGATVHAFDNTCSRVRWATSTDKNYNMTEEFRAKIAFKPEYYGRLRKVCGTSEML